MKYIVLAILAFCMLAGLAHAQLVTVSSYNIDPSPTIPGQTFTLYAYVYNSSPISAIDTVFTLELGSDTTDSSFPFSIEPTDTLTRSLGTVLGFSTVLVKYQIQVDPAALDGQYTINLKASSQNQSGGVLPIVINIVARKPILSIIQSSPTQVEIGHTDSLQLTLKNTGSSTATNILVSLQEDRTVTSTGAVVERDIVPLGASTQFVSSLGVGSTTIVNVPILVNPSASSKPYYVPVTIEYYDENKSLYTETSYLGLKVVGSPNLEAIVADAEPLLVPGGKSRLTIDLFNNGLGPAKFVQAQVDAGFFSIPSDAFFIGTIESDDFDSLLLDGIVSSSVSPGEYPVDVHIQYKNEFGDSFSFTKVVNVRVYSPGDVPSANGDNGFPIWIFLIVIVGIGYWWFKIRKKKNGNGNGK
ncbi:MAG: hypothetical protein V1776_00270 [Candidatus Diapherotrites archaeon]